MLLNGVGVNQQSETDFRVQVRLSSILLACFFAKPAAMIQRSSNTRTSPNLSRCAFASSAAEDNYTQSQNPHIAPETSFELLVSSYIQEEIARVLDEVVTETIEAENAQTEQRLGR